MLIKYLNEATSKFECKREEISKFSIYINKPSTNSNIATSIKITYCALHSLAKDFK